MSAEPEAPGTPRLLLRFDAPAAVLSWGAIDDRVMGGVSRSRLRHDPAGWAVFEGEVSLERNGGFASVRSQPQALGRPEAVACLIEARGDGHRFKLRLLTDDSFDAVSYQAGFAPEAGRWSTVRLPLAGFVPTFRGRVVADAPPLDPARIRQIGLLIADRQVGPFALAIRSIELE
jgi:NADH dehydrogenase [ubiquinone] 1 alpha subcomplex assembly factor 1